MSVLRKKPSLLIGVLALLLITIPLTIITITNRQNVRSKADRTVILSFDPASTTSAPLQIPAGGTFSMDVLLDPGASSVSFVKAEILYDTTKVEPAGGFIPNQDVFSQVVVSPPNTPGKITTTLSVGSDTSKAVTTKTKIGTVVFKALSNVTENATAEIQFGSGTQALSISSNSSFDENVIANTIPAAIRFNKINQTCGTTPSDTMLVMDVSDSMNEQSGTSGSKITNAKTAASNFIDIQAQNTDNKIGLVSYMYTSKLESPLSSDYTAVKNTVNALTMDGYTCIECGINTANQEIAANKRPGIKNVVILLTDGQANYIQGTNNEVDGSLAEQKAIEAADRGHTQNGTIYYTIGLGNDVNSDFLTALAESTGGQYYFSPSADQLNKIYDQISQLISKAAITGNIYNDKNKNGIQDSGEDGLSGWLLQLTSSTGQIQSITSDSTGTYSFPGLCDGSYTVSQVNKTGWRQTIPVNPSKYAVNIANGNGATDIIFGNYQGTRCSDGIDNDGNGFIDEKDSTCHTDGNPGNPNSYNPSLDGENAKNTCSDGKDNNNDGKIDGADPVCHPDGDMTKPWDPNLSEGTKQTKLYCSPSAVALNETPKELSVLLKTMSGEPVVGKTVTWSASSSAIAFSPVTATTDATGKASSSAVISTQNIASFSGTISAKFAGDTAYETASCVLNASFEGSYEGATVALEVLMHGVGNSGDNANPGAFSFSNKNPLTPERTALVELYNINNQLISSGSGKISYSSQSGSFKGSIKTVQPVPPGKYTVKVGSDYHLRRLVPGIQTLVVRQTNNLPTIQMVAGDATIDNRLDIRDYNMLLDCYSDLRPAVACNPSKKIATDANDDGNVNQYDYNLFLREISTQPGE